MDYIKFQELHPELFDNESGMLKIITNPEEISAWQTKYRVKLEAKSEPAEWADIGILLEDKFITFLRDLVEFAPGVLGGYGRLVNSADLKGGQAVVILPIFKGKVVLLHQFRHATRQWHFEIPRGFGEIGLSPEENAHKEIDEEIGGKIEELIDLGDYHNNTGLEGSVVKLFYARIKSLGKPETREG